MNKKGLSSVISTILIILISIVAILILWNVISGILSSGGDSLSTMGLSANMAITSFSINEAEKVAMVRVKYKPSFAKNLNITSLNFVIYDDSTSETYTITLSGGFVAPDEKTFYLDLITSELILESLKEVSVIPIYEKNGKNILLTNSLSTYKIKNLQTTTNSALGYEILGTTYYISFTLGNDENDGTSSLRPWKTLSKINSKIFQPGDAILFNRGETWYGQLNVSSSGNESMPLTYGAYGSGSLPTISGLETLSSWTSVGNGVYKSFCANCSGSLNRVLLNGENKIMGRYPNSEYLTFESFFGTSSITDNELSASPDWTGAELVLRTSHWTLDRDKITSQSGGTIYYTPSKSGSYTPLGDVNGYFIQGDLRTLDKVGEWFFNQDEKYVYMYFGSENPSSKEVKISTVGDLLNVYEKKNIVIDSLEIRGSNLAGVVIKNSQNITLQNSEINFAGTNGLSADKISFLSVKNNIINNSNNDAMYLAENWGMISNSLVENNVIDNSGIVPGMGQGGIGNYHGIILLKGNYVNISLNKIYNSGYIPINFYGDFILVENNLVDTFGFTLDDCGGIYTFRSSISDPVTLGNKIKDNIVLNGIGAKDGTKDRLNSSSGIYTDGYSTNIEISGNTVANCVLAGFLANSNINGNITGNTFYNNTEQIHLQEQDAIETYTNLNMKNNVYFSAQSFQKSFEYQNAFGSLDPTFSFDNNFFIKPLGDDYVIHTSTLEDSRWPGKYYTLKDWQNAQGLDLNSKGSPSKVPTFIINDYLSQNLYSNGNFDSNIAGINCWNNALSCVLSWISAGLDGGSLNLSYKSIPSTSDTGISLPFGEVSSGDNYLLKYDSKGTNAGYYWTYLMKLSSPYTVLTPREITTVNSSRIKNEFLFSYPKSDPGAGIYFATNQSLGNVLFDNVELYQVDATITNPADYFLFEYNPTMNDKTVNLNREYLGVDGTTYSGSVVIKPFKSIVLIKK